MPWWTHFGDISSSLYISISSPWKIVNQILFLSNSIWWRNCAMCYDLKPGMIVLQCTHFNQNRKMWFSRGKCNTMVFFLLHWLLSNAGILLAPYVLPFPQQPWVSRDFFGNLNLCWLTNPFWSWKLFITFNNTVRFYFVLLSSVPSNSNLFGECWKFRKGNTPSGNCRCDAELKWWNF